MAENDTQLDKSGRTIWYGRNSLSKSGKTPYSESSQGSVVGVDRKGSTRKRTGKEAPGGDDKEESGRSTSVVEAPVVATPQERTNARQLLSEIGKRFALNRKQSKSKAFEMYQQDLANNQGILVMGGAVTLKELTVLLMDLEAFMKSTVREGETAASRLQKFLAGELSDEVE